MYSHPELENARIIPQEYEKVFIVFPNIKNAISIQEKLLADENFEKKTLYTELQDDPRTRSPRSEEGPWILVLTAKEYDALMGEEAFDKLVADYLNESSDGLPLFDEANFLEVTFDQEESSDESSDEDPPLPNLVYTLLNLRREVEESYCDKLRVQDAERMQALEKQLKEDMQRLQEAEENSPDSPLDIPSDIQTRETYYIEALTWLLDEKPKVTPTVDRNIKTQLSASAIRALHLERAAREIKDFKQLLVNLQKNYLNDPDFIGWLSQEESYRARIQALQKNTSQDLEYLQKNQIEKCHPRQEYTDALSWLQVKTEERVIAEEGVSAKHCSELAF